MSEETKQKISNSLKGEKHPNYGVKWSPSVRKRMSIGSKGKNSGINNHNFGKKLTEEERKMRSGVNNPVYGKHWKLSEETKQKMSIKGKGRIVSEETKKKLSLNHIGKCLGPDNPNWKGGITFGKYCFKFNKYFKSRVRKFFNNICVMCGKSNVDNGNELHVHHVEYDKQACCNNNKFSFVILCNHCHTRTNFDREKWIYMFHYIINEIYDGKSYYTQEELTLLDGDYV